MLSAEGEESAERGEGIVGCGQGRKGGECLGDWGMWMFLVEQGLENECLGGLVFLRYYDCLLIRKRPW